LRHEKAIWSVVLWCVVFPGYYAIGLHQDPSHAHRLASRIDHAIPFNPLWMWAYAGVYTALLLPLFVVRCNRLFRRVALAYLGALLVSYVCYLVYPVTTEGFRPAVETIDTREFWCWGAALNFTLDPPMNCFPSLHVATITLATLAALRADRVIGVVALVIAILITVSTLFVKQHYLADVVAGAALAFASYAIFIRGYDPMGQKPEEIRRPRWAFLLYLGLYLFALFGILWPLYMKDVKPWIKAEAVAPVGSR